MDTYWDSLDFRFSLSPSPVTSSTFPLQSSITLKNLSISVMFCTFIVLHSFLQICSAMRFSPSTHHYNHILPDCNAFFPDLDLALFEKTAHRTLKIVLSKTELRADQLRVSL